MTTAEKSKSILRQLKEVIAKIKVKPGDVLSSEQNVNLIAKELKKWAAIPSEPQTRANQFTGEQIVCEPVVCALYDMALSIEHHLRWCFPQTANQRKRAEYLCKIHFMCRMAIANLSPEAWRTLID